jgi:hypothetical protein
MEVGLRSLQVMQVFDRRIHPLLRFKVHLKSAYQEIGAALV